jgi:hypothetical protein
VWCRQREIEKERLTVAGLSPLFDVGRCLPARRSRPAAAEAPASLSRSILAESPAAESRRVARDREGTGSCSAGTGAGPRLQDKRDRHRLLRSRSQSLPRHLATPEAKLMARVGQAFPLQCPWVWRRHPADRVQAVLPVRNHLWPSHCRQPPVAADILSAIRGRSGTSSLSQRAVAWAVKMACSPGPWWRWRRSAPQWWGLPP